MGLFMAPFRGLMRVFEEVADRAERELYDEEAVREELIEAYQRLEAGTLSEEDFSEKEEELVERLEEIAARQRQKSNRGRN